MKRRCTARHNSDVDSLHFVVKHYFVPYPCTNERTIHIKAIFYLRKQVFRLWVQSDYKLYFGGENLMMNSSWLICPVCGGKTRDQIRSQSSS
ncbi:MAG: hypothetical protein KH296_13505 [Ruminococcus sp.]|nr:hypothetical protein [Ruminococcus sp.]